MQKYLKIDLELVINENRSTMLSILEKKRGSVRLSLHKMFLDAPERVIIAVAHYVDGKTKLPHVSQHHLVLRSYIQQNLSRFQRRLDQKKLEHVGEVYDLKFLYRELNERYFGGNLNLSVTWCGAYTSPRTQITLGQYQESMRLIKVHRKLDDVFCPAYFVSYILYHEMVHAVVPGYVDRRGRFCIHGKAFKERERIFEHYWQAIAWEKENKEYFFKSPHIFTEF